MELKGIIENPDIETLTHAITGILAIYVFYMLATKPETRTIENIIFIAILFSLGTLVHQNINFRNNARPTYFGLV